MNKVLIQIGIVSLAMAVNVSVWAKGACMPIALACKGEGKYNSKQELIKNCVIPVVNGQKSFPNVTDKQKTACRETLKQKMKGKMKTKMQDKAQTKVQATMQQGTMQPQAPAQPANSQGL